MTLSQSAPSLEFVLQRRGIASSREMSEAAARCELHGGDLTTSLLQFIDADEAQLSAALSDCHGLPAAPLGLLPQSDEAVRLQLPREVAERYCCFPLFGRGTSLTLSVAEPLEAGVKEELSFALGVEIEEQVALEVRIRQAIARDYGLSLSPRDLRAIARLEGELEDAAPETPTGLWAVSSLSSLPRPPSKLPGQTPRPLATSSLRVLAPKSGTPRPRTTLKPGDAPNSVPNGEPGFSSRQEISVDSALKPSTLQAETLQAETLRDGTPRVGSVQSVANIASIGDSPAVQTRAMSSAEESVDSTSLSRSSRRPADSAKRPMSLARLEQELGAARTRNDVLRTFFNFSSQFFEYAALFSIQENLAEGLDARGHGTQRDTIVGIGVPLDLPSSLARVISTGKPFVGSLGREGLDATLLRDLRRNPSSNTVLMPVYIRKRCVLVFYADCGGTELLEAEIKEVFGTAINVGTALERVLLARKRARAEPKKVTEHSATPGATQSRSDRVRLDQSASELEAVVGTPVVNLDPPTSSPSELSVSNFEQGDQGLTEDPVFLLERPKSNPYQAGESKTGAVPDSAPLSDTGSSNPVLDSSTLKAPPLDEGPMSTAPSSMPPASQPISLRASYPPRRYELKRLPSVIVRNEPPPSPILVSSGVPLSTETPGLGIDVEVDITPANLNIDVMVEHSPAPLVTLFTESGEHEVGTSPPTPRPILVPSNNSVPTTALSSVEPTPALEPSATAAHDAATGLAKTADDAPAVNSVITGANSTGDNAENRSAESTQDAESLVTVALLDVASRNTAPTSGSSATPSANTPVPESLPAENNARAVGESNSTVDALPIPQSLERERPVDSEPSVVSDAVTRSSRSPEGSPELKALVDRLCDGDLAAGQKVAEMGDQSVPELMRRFPGPVITERAGPSSRASECGPLLQTLAAIGTPATANITPFTVSDDVHVRRWATLLLGELPGPEACRAIVERLGDDSPRVHQAALDAARLILRGTSANLFRQTLFEVAENDDTPSNLRLRTLEHVAKLQDSESVPRLIDLLDSGPTPARHKVLWALTVITRHDFGRAPKAWYGWWEAHKSQHRIQWLIDALDNSDRRLRKAAGNDLRTETKETYGFNADQPVEARKQAQRLYRQWWKTVGARRFENR